MHIPLLGICNITAISQKPKPIIIAVLPLLFRAIVGWGILPHCELWPLGALCFVTRPLFSEISESM
jgi:hypothetical protein